MKPEFLLCLLLLPSSLVCCRKKETSHPATGESSRAAGVEPIDHGIPPASKYKSERLPRGSQEDYDRYVKAGGTPSIAHDTPPMDKMASGIYSYLGAARQFKAICGFDLPDWVEPVKGNFTVSIRNSGAVRQSWLEYRIDPARRAELERLISEANARQFPQRHPVEFVQSSSQPGTRVGFIDFKPDGNVKERMGATLEEDGTVTLRSSRGPVGWDE